VFAAIYIPDFSLQSVLRHEPELISKPVVLTDPALTKPCVVQLTPAARASGICAGMSPSQALARCESLAVKIRSLPQEQAAMEALMQTAYAFSPHLEATAPGVCTIELKGLAIQPNEASAKHWAAEILRVLKQFHLSGQIGFAETPALALLAAHAAKPVLVTMRRGGDTAPYQHGTGRARLEGPARAPHRANGERPSSGAATPIERSRASTFRANLNKQTCCARGRALSDNDFTSTLPIEALDLPFESLEILKRWGINTAGAFLALGKDALAQRLGPAIVEVFDRLSTHSVRPLNIASPPETFAEEIEFQNEIETLEPLLFILRRFVEQLSRRIELLYLVVAELHLKLGLTSGATYERAFMIPSPTGNAETLFRVLHTHLENLRTDAPIVTLRLSAKPGRPESHQFGLFETTLRNPNQFAETLARLTALCGSDRIGTPVLEATYRPDTFQMKAPDFRTNLERTFHTRAKTPSACSSRRKEALTHNPKGIASISPGLPRIGRSGSDRGYPGTKASNVHNPERGASNARRSIHKKQFLCGLPLRRFRPPLPACIELREQRPVLMRSAIFNGIITDARGPFFSSGNWWENNRWWREEWDIQTVDGTLYRIFRPAEEVGETVGRSYSTRVALAPPATTTLESNEHAPSVESGIGLPHSKTLREIEKPQNLRQVGARPSSGAATSAGTCASKCSSAPSDLWLAAPEDGRAPMAESRGEGEERVPLQGHGFEYFVEGIYD
jgi:protein ImuB